MLCTGFCRRVCTQALPAQAHIMALELLDTSRLGDIGHASTNSSLLGAWKAQTLGSTQADGPRTCTCLLHVKGESKFGVGAQAHATFSLASLQVQLHTADYTPQGVSIKNSKP